MDARGWLGRLALSLASLAGAALLAEAGLRLAGWAPEKHRAPARVHGARGRVLLDCFPTNPRGSFDLDLRDPATRARYEALGMARLGAVARRAPHAVEVRLNSHRFRDAELGPKPAGTTRVMVLGDSFTEGQGVREPDTCVRRLERLLNAQGGRWEVRNCARRATDFPELYRTFEELLAFDPDVVVHAMVLNDAERSPEFEARQSYLNDWIVDQARWADPAAPPFGPLEPRLVALFAQGVQGWRVGRETTRWYRDMYGEPNREGWRSTQRALREMNRRMKERGGRFVVMLWPLLVGLQGGYPFEDVHQVLGRFFLEAGIDHLDLLPVLRGRPAESLWVYPVDMHPNEEANRLAAESLAAFLRREAAP